jgi:hypothetical protein
VISRLGIIARGHFALTRIAVVRWFVFDGCHLVEKRFIVLEMKLIALSLKCSPTLLTFVPANST